VAEDPVLKTGTVEVRETEDDAAVEVTAGEVIEYKEMCYAR